MIEGVSGTEKGRREARNPYRLATVNLLLFPIPWKPLALLPVARVQSTPFIMTMPVSLTKDDPSCGYKLPQDPHIGFLSSPPLQNLTIPSYPDSERREMEMDRKCTAD